MSADINYNFNKKIAVLFRGPIRPDLDTVVSYSARLLQELRYAGFNVTSYIATWKDYNKDEVKKILATDLYNNVILQQKPTPERIKQYVSRECYGIYPTSNVFNMYYQSKTAIDLIAATDEYNYIVHSRTDLYIKFGKYINDWFDGEQYSSPVRKTPWICDWISIAKPDIMQSAWNYYTNKQLGILIDNTEIPEHILISMIEHNNIQVKICDVEDIWLNPDRNK